MEHGGSPSFAWATAIEASPLGAIMRESLFLYPLANLVHLLGLTMLIGPIGLLDLRLLGFGRSVPVVEASRLLTPWAIGGLILLIFSGLALFSADAGPLAITDVFQLKMLLLALGLGNAILFRVLWKRRLAGWDEDPPALGRLHAVLSLAGWLLVGSFGRLIAYG